jgi:hypothetical protein
MSCKSFALTRTLTEIASTLDAAPHCLDWTQPTPMLVAYASTGDPHKAPRAVDDRPATPPVQSQVDHTGRVSPPSAHPHLPEPTYWPATLAFGITLLAWGIVTTYAISLVGLLVICVAIGGWIGDLLHEH